MAQEHSNGTSSRFFSVRRILVYTLLFAIMASAVFFPFWANGVSFMYYVGEEMDGLSQHYTAFIYISNYIRDCAAALFRGDALPMQFDFNLGFGDDVIGTLGFYGFGNPLMLLSAFITNEGQVIFYQCYVLLELWIAGLTFQYYCHNRNIPFINSLIGTFVFIFTGFVFWAGICHPEFISPMIYFPLLLTGVDKCLTEKRTSFLSICTALFALIGYYWLYSATFFTCIYAVTRFFEEPTACDALAKTPDGMRTGRIAEFARFSIRIAFAYVLGICAACILLLPNLYGFLQSVRTEGEEGLPALIPSLLDASRSYSNLISVSSWNFAALAVIALPSVLFLLSRASGTSRALKALIIILGAMCFFPIFGWIFNAGAYASTRWMVYLCFFASWFVALSATKIIDVKATKWAWALSIVTYAIAVTLNFLIYAWTPIYVIALLLLLSCLACSILFGGKDATRGSDEKSKALFKSRATLALCIILAINLAANAQFVYTSLGFDYISSFATFEQIEGEEAKITTRDALSLDREPWQRIEQATSTNPNASMIFSYPSVSSYFSTSNGTTSRFFDEMGIPSKNKVLLPGLDSRPELESIFGVRYWTTSFESTIVPFGFSRIAETVWENDDPLPFAFSYDNEIAPEIWANAGPIGKQTLLVKGAYVSKGKLEGSLGQASANPEIKTCMPKVLDAQNVSCAENGLEVGPSGGWVRLGFEKTPDTETYLCFEGLSVASNDGVEFPITTVSDSGESSFVLSDDSYRYHPRQETTVFNLGHGDDGISEATIRFAQAGSLSYASLSISNVPLGSLRHDLEKLKSVTLDDIEFRPNRIKGSVSTSDTRIMAFQIPYSSGWNVTIDGKPTETLCVNDIELGVEIEPGEHEIILEYASPLIREGTIVTLLGVIGIAIMAFLQRRSQRPSMLKE